MQLKVKLTSAAQKHLQEAVKQKVGPKIENLAFGLHEEILDKTPVNTGRTLASWKLTRKTPSNHDAGDTDDFSYLPGVDAATNHLPIGAEPHRWYFEKMAKEGRNALQIQKQPYDIFYVSNAAKVDSLFDSGFDQGQEGLRAALQDAGIIPDYDFMTGEHGVYNHRGQGMFERAIASFLRNHKKHLKDKTKQ